MEEKPRFRRLLERLRLLLHLIAAELFVHRRLISPVAFWDLVLSLSFLRRGLSPVTLDLAGCGATIRLWAPIRRRPGRLPLVLIHGFGGNAKWQWDRQIRRLSRTFDLYVPDLVFFGGSLSASKERSVEFQARCLATAMRKLGVRRYAVAGISYGGFVAYRMAADTAAAEVERVVILTAGVAVTPEQRREMLAREGRDVSEIFLPSKAEDLTALIRRSMYRPPRWLPEFILTDFVEVIYKEHRLERVGLLRELLEKGAGVDPLPVLEQPTLLLWGDQDKVFPLHLAYQFQRHLGEKASLEVVEDAGHALQLEKHALVNHLMERFLLGKDKNESS